MLIKILELLIRGFYLDLIQILDLLTQNLTFFTFRHFHQLIFMAT